MSNTPIRVFVEADVKCFHCGQIVGVTRSDRGEPRARSTFLATGATDEVALRRLGDVRCPRCGGPTYLDEFQTRYELGHIDFNDDVDDERPRRGRPPKWLADLRRGAA